MFAPPLKRPRLKGTRLAGRVPDRKSAIRPSRPSAPQLIALHARLASHRREDGPRGEPAAPAVQRKLAIGRADDPLELEADRVAERVMQMPAAGGTPDVKGRCEACRTEAGALRRAGAKETPHPGGAVPAVVHAVLGSSGRRLEANARAYFEPRFGRDFSDVRIHDDAWAAESAATLGAQAYTHGNHVVFAGNVYAPGSSAGRRLLAHELTHVVQQSGDAVRPSPAEVDCYGASPISQSGSGPQPIRRQVPPHMAAGGGRAVGRCHTTQRATGPEHRIIQNEYINYMNPTAGGREYFIPHAGLTGGPGYADFVDVRGYEIFEIKSEAEARTGRAQIRRYVPNANAYCPPPQGQWTPGTNYPDAHTILVGANEYLTVRRFRSIPGVIIYEPIRRRPPVPAPALAPAPATAAAPNPATSAAPGAVPVQTTTPVTAPPAAGPRPLPTQRPAWERVRDLVWRVVRTGEDPERAATQFLRENQDLIDYLQTFSVVLAIGTLLEDIVSGGTGVADDLPTLSLAWALRRAAAMARVARATR